ncbi:hypothetical protein Barb7_00794 [Bacteroidales bacterium Barb7]|nr:hypothetical protein Barb7_00794 [Bacteroidales bacterium Barb7]
MSRVFLYDTIHNALFCTIIRFARPTLSGWSMDENTNTKQDD